MVVPKQEDTQMIFVGIDVHYKNSVICFLDPTAPGKQQSRTTTVPTTREALVRALGPLEGRCKIAYEVGAQAQWVGSILKPLAEEVQVANPSRMPWLFREGRKDDRLDARKLATLLYLGQLPTVHLPSGNVSAWRALINHRRSLINRRTMVKNQIRALLRSFGHHCPYRSCWTTKGQVWLRSLTFDDARNLMMRMLLQELNDLESRRKEIELQLDGIARTQPAVALLRTIRGVGPRTAEAIVAFTDQVSRFRRSRQLAAYFGMTPTLDASGTVVRHGHISKRGPSVVRWVIVESAHQVLRHCPALRTFYDRVYGGKKDRRKKAIVAVARKLLTIMFAMLRDGTAFNQRRLESRAA
jgi:transposase